MLSAESLESSNPFLPPGYGEKKEAPKPVVQSNGPISREIEFRGLVKMKGQYQFSLFNKRDQKSYWLKENEAAAQGISVRNYDSGSQSLTVSMSGRTERITLIAANSSPLPVVASVSPPVNTMAMPSSQSLHHYKMLQNQIITMTSNEQSPAAESSYRRSRSYVIFSLFCYSQNVALADNKQLREGFEPSRP